MVTGFALLKHCQCAMMAPKRPLDHLIWGNGFVLGEGAGRCLKPFSMHSKGALRFGVLRAMAALAMPIESLTHPQMAGVLNRCRLHCWMQSGPMILVTSMHMGLNPDE